MFKVLIVDDEDWILKGLKGRINWKEYGFSVVGQALNGVEAYEKIMQLMPDVVFTDIRMPKMNGLELIKKVKETSLNIEFVILSGYADFTYAQKAINYGAVGYCVKPFDEDEIIAMLKKISCSMQKARFNFDAQIFELLENDSEDSRIKITKLLQEAGLVWDDEGMLVVVSVGTGEIRLPAGTRQITLNLGVDKKAYLMSFSNRTRVKEFLEMEYPANIRGIGISEKIDDVAGIRNAIEKTEIAAHQFFITSGHSVIEACELRYEELSGILIKLDESICNKDVAAVEKLFPLIYGLFRNGHCTIKHAYQIYNMVIYFIYKQASACEEQYLGNYRQLIALFAHVDEMIGYLKEQVMIKLKQEQAYEGIENDAFKLIIQYINENFHKEISLQSLSKEYFVSPGYITRLFRKEMGETFIEFLSKMRIKHACDLLKKSNLPIHEISEKVGYNDYFYFSRIFKKTTGKTPTQYKSEVV